MSMSRDDAFGLMRNYQVACEEAIQVTQDSGASGGAVQEALSRMRYWERRIIAQEDEMAPHILVQIHLRFILSPPRESAETS